MNVSKLTVAQLKEELTKRDADLSGLKKDLMERLQPLIDAEGGGDDHGDLFWILVGYPQAWGKSLEGKLTIA